MIALAILVLGIIVVLVAVIGSLGNIKRSALLMQSTSERLQKQMEGVQTESTALQTKVEHLSNDFKEKADDVKTVVSAAKSITTNLDDMNLNVQQITSKITKKVNNDPEAQAYTEQMTNQIMGFAEKLGARKNKENTGTH